MRAAYETWFQKSVLDAPGAVLVVFYDADLSNDLHNDFMKTMRTLQGQSEKSFTMVSTADDKVMERFGINTSPSLLLFRDGQRIDDSVLRLPEQRGAASLKSWLDQALTKSANVNVLSLEGRVSAASGRIREVPARLLELPWRNTYTA